MAELFESVGIHLAVRVAQTVQDCFREVRRRSDHGAEKPQEFSSKVHSMLYNRSLGSLRHD
jgi:hypothetical protein